MPKPAWLHKRTSLHDTRRLKEKLRGSKLHTVCEESRCPNMSECFSRSTATFLILGAVCTRQCAFCSVTKGTPLPPDAGEPLRVAEAADKLGLAYVVVTSPTRDDLSDGGASFFCDTVRLLMREPSRRVEILIPDFLGDTAALEAVSRSGAFVIGHNLETVPSLYIEVRSGARYARSLEVLAFLKRTAGPGVYTKSGLMLGLGEKRDEVVRVLHDLRSVGCDYVTLGQYLPPSRGHYPLREYVRPRVFTSLKKQALAMGFRGVHAGPYVRSSYLAHTLVAPAR